MIFADLLNYETLLPFALFGMFAALAWWAMDALAAGKPRTLERLDELKAPNARRAQASSALKKRDAVTRVLEKATPALAKPLEPKSEIERSKLKLRLANAGFRGESAPSIFLGLKFVGLLAGLALGGGSMLGLAGLSHRAALGTILMVALGFYLPDLAVWYLGRRRKEAVFLGLPDALDLLTICVEAGLGFEQAMGKVYAKWDDDLALSGRRNETEPSRDRRRIRAGQFPASNGSA